MERGHWRRKPGQVVYTHDARCRDCYRCLRACPIKAIRVVDGQAYVDSDRCIACGTCIRECPQKAKAFRNDIEKAQRLIGSGAPVAASVAPSFAALLDADGRGRLPAALRRMGFTFVAETAVGAFEVARRTAEIAAKHPGGTLICTACPAVTAYIEQYEPDLAPLLAPLVSPMIAHARRIKKRLGPGARVIFLGPCVTKKAEAERPELAGDVDCVLTFAEMADWMDTRGVSLADCPVEPFDEEPGGDARFFPLPGGLTRTAGLGADALDPGVVAVSGVDELRQALDNARASGAPMLLEPLFCAQGCVNGAGMPERGNLFGRRGGVLEFARTHPGAADARPPEGGAALLAAEYRVRSAADGDFPEERIREVLEKTGKGGDADQLNCGACGYASCRDQAVAVLNGMATPEMCIPHMRRLAEQRGDKIIETTPNGVVILDGELNLLAMNPAFRAMFQCGDAVLGKRVSLLMDADPFERVLSGAAERFEATVRHERYRVVCHQIIYLMPDVRQVVGVFVDITNTVESEETLERLRAETARKAQELLDHQVQMAQEMARFLGQSTAQSEELVANMMRLARARRERPEEG